MEKKSNTKQKISAKTAKALIRAEFAFFVFSACFLSFIWITSQFRPRIDIALLYQVEKLITCFSFSSMFLAILHGVPLKYLNRKVFKLDNYEDFIVRDLNQNAKWLFWLLFIFIISEIVHNLLGHPAALVEFYDGSWVLVYPRANPIPVMEVIAYDRLWNECRAWSGMPIFWESVTAFAIYSFMKLCNRSLP